MLPRQTILILLALSGLIGCSSEDSFDLAVQQLKESVGEHDTNHNEDYYISQFLKYFPKASVYRNLSGKHTSDIFFRNKNGILNPMTNKQIRVQIEFDDNNLSRKVMIYKYVEISGKTMEPDQVFLRVK